MNAHADQLAGTRPKQARSRARKAALIEHGAAMLEERELDEISVADLTGALGFSTGSFYSYFRDKDAFFVAVQAWVSGELAKSFDATFDEARISGQTLAGRLETCVGFALGYFRRRTGAIRSALRYERRIPDGWAPNRAMTRRISEAVTRDLGEEDRIRLGTALQMAFGLLVNSLLHDPGPLRLGDRDIERRITLALSPYLSEERR